MAAGEPAGAALNFATGVLAPATRSGRPHGAFSPAEGLVFLVRPRNGQRLKRGAKCLRRRAAVSATGVAGGHTMVTLNSTSSAPSIPSSLKPRDR